MIDRPYFRSLRGRITNQMLFIGVLSVVALGAPAYLGVATLLERTDHDIESSRQTMGEVVGGNLGGVAGRITRRLDEYMLERIRDIVSLAASPSIVRAAREAADKHAARGLVGLDIKDVEARFSNRKSLGLFPTAEQYLRDQVRRSPHFGEIFFTDMHGYNAALTNPTSDFVQSDEAWWIDAFNDGVSVGEVEFDNSANIWSIDISVRISDANAHVGVMKAVLGVSLIQEVSDTAAAQIPGGEITVVNRNGELLAETASRHAQDRIMNPRVNLKSDGDAAELLRGKRDQVSRQIGDAIYAYARSAGGDFYRGVAERFGGFGWSVLVQQPAQIALAPIRGLTEIQQDLAQAKRWTLFIIGGVFAFVLALVVVVGGLLAKRIVSPIRQLQVLADLVSKGDTRQAVQIRSNDEIEDLAQIFDRMRTSIQIIIKRYQTLKAQSTSPPPPRSNS